MTFGKTAVCDTLSSTYGKTDGYHTSCYKNFTAVAKVMETPAIEPEVTITSKTGILRSDVKHVSSSTASGVFQRVCIFQTPVPWART